MSNGVSPADRRAFVAERRRAAVYRWDTMHSPCQVPGEDFEGGEQGGHHYYPARDQARDWLTAAGFGVQDEQDADSYWHFLLQRR